MLKAEWGRCSAFLRCMCWKPRPSPDKNMSLLGSDNFHRHSIASGGSFRRSKKLRNDKKGDQSKYVEVGSLGRCAPGEAWPPGTEWPHQMPEGSMLPSQAVVLPERYKVLIREASLRPGILLVYRGPQVRAPGADGGIPTYSVWNGALS